MINIILGGLFLGSIVFLFTFTASKKNGKYYMAPIITFFFFIAVTAYGVIVIRGFEGMGYGLLGVGFLIASIVGTLLLPLLTRSKGARQFGKKDKLILFTLPILFFATIGLSIYFEQGYWIIETNYVEGEGNYYEISTISEGKKQVSLILGEKYFGKDIEVEKVSKWGPTEITVKIVDGGNEDKFPYIRIGLDEIKDPLKVQTTDGVVFESVRE
ncbi:YesK family protein [Oceanobacillus massiliensis]|uniref:YesK family protein n=1 Tax=Oceanobacillus massiliensis TaxID=1465765 RepID=UPI000287BDAF|nr:YesK family protein [Oceanobacillus massiliensis]